MGAQSGGKGAHIPIRYVYAGRCPVVAVIVSTLSEEAAEDQLRRLRGYRPP